MLQERGALLCMFLQCLLLYQFRVNATLVNQLAMCSTFGYLAILQDEDMVRILNG